MLGRMQDVRWQRLANPELGSLSRRLDQDWRPISATQEVLDRQPTRGGRIGAGRVSFFFLLFFLFTLLIGLIVSTQSTVSTLRGSPKQSDIVILVIPQFVVSGLEPTQRIPSPVLLTESQWGC